MCWKKRKDGTEPKSASQMSRTLKSTGTPKSTATPNSTGTPKSTATPKSTSTSLPSNSHTSTDFTTDWSRYKDSSKTSSSTRTSLASFRDSLPENPNIYGFPEICAATNNFLSKRLSSSSDAWRCSIRNKDVVVIQRKLRRRVDISHIRDKLLTICKSHHGSIIKLLGASISGDHIFLVYDYVSGANLVSCLRNPNNPDFTVLSSWISRMHIATDLAQGIEYIHHYTGLEMCTVHNHIKSTSVIVTDPSLNAKICHFGTAELSGEISGDQIGEISMSPSDTSKRPEFTRVSKIEGTRGYMAPELIADGIVSQKSDVFAFGVVLLELFSGEENVKYRYDKESGDYLKISLIDSAREAIESTEIGNLRRWVDRRLRDSFPVEVAEKMIRVALECVHVEADKRPDMRRVAGKISKLNLESRKWSEKMKIPTEFTVSLAPR